MKVNRRMNPLAKELYTEHEWLSHVPGSMPSLMQDILRWACMYAERHVYSPKYEDRPTEVEKQLVYDIFNRLNKVPVFKDSIYLPKKGALTNRLLTVVDAAKEDYEDWAYTYINQVADRHNKIGVSCNSAIVSNMVGRCKEYMVSLADELCTNGHITLTWTDKALERAFMTFPNELNRMLFIDTNKAG